MESHDLARILLENENLPIATYTNRHTYGSSVDCDTHGSCKAAIVDYFSEKHIMIGNLELKKTGNWHIIEMIRG